MTAMEADGHAPSVIGWVPAAGWLTAVALLAGLGLMVAGRWAATRVALDPLIIGTVFGLALGGLAIGGLLSGARASAAPAIAGAGAGARAASPDRVRRTWATARHIAIGGAFGLALVGVAVGGAALAGAQVVPGLGRPAAEFAPWAAITILVASAEEALLRGRLFDVLRRAGGVLPAVVVTTAAFALMHVPLYGWHVVPLDVAVGLGLAGLRLATGGVAAPAVAHSTADLATWWL